MGRRILKTPPRKITSCRFEKVCEVVVQLFNTDTDVFSQSYCVVFYKYYIVEDVHLCALVIVIHWLLIKFFRCLDPGHVTFSYGRHIDIRMRHPLRAHHSKHSHAIIESSHASTCMHTTPRKRNPPSHVIISIYLDHPNLAPNPLSRHTTGTRTDI